MPDAPIREHVVNALNAAVTNDDSDAVAELWPESTPDERRAVADRQGSIASLLEDRAAALRLFALKRAVDLLMPHWQSKPTASDGRVTGYETQTLGAVLKTAPPDVVAEALRYLRDFGWLADDDDDDGDRRA